MKTTAKIFDKFTDLPVSRQRKWQLRHPGKAKKAFKKFSVSDTYKKWKNQKYKDSVDSKKHSS